MNFARPLPLVLAVLLLFAAHWASYEPSEPFYNNDETRHVMTGVYFHDVIRDLPLRNAKQYTLDYYARYPALGLLVWPPFFYGVEGVFMSIFGTSFLGARILIGLFTCLACIYLYLLVLPRTDRFTASVAVVLFGLSPLVMTYSRHVMLEMPTLAFALASIYHFVRYIEHDRRWDLAFATAAAAFCALTRFDGAFLLPFFLIWLVAARRVRRLFRREIVVAAVLALIVVAPMYWLTINYFGRAHTLAVRSGTAAGSTSFMNPGNFVYYPSILPVQVGWFILVPAVIGAAAALRPAVRNDWLPFYALAAATYLTFSPMAELDARHTIYWIPAVVAFAAYGLTSVASALRKPVLRYPLAAIVVAGAAYPACTTPALYVRGYKEAAEYVIAETQQPTLCLFDSFLNGDFIFQTRRHDPGKRVWILRGDKIFYSMLSDPHAVYHEYVHTDQSILDLLYRYDPEFIIVEEPQIFFNLEAAELVRKALRGHPERFRMEKIIPIESNLKRFEGAKLVIYRNVYRNPNPDKEAWLPVLGLRQDLQAPIRPGSATGAREIDQPPPEDGADKK